MGKICCLCMCSQRKKATKIGMFSFPKCLEMRRKWIDQIPTKDLDDLDNKYVCELHFEEHQIIRGQRTLLLSQVYPTIFFYKDEIETNVDIEIDGECVNPDVVIGDFNILVEQFERQVTLNFLCVYKIVFSESEHEHKPSIEVSIIIKDDLAVEVFYKNQLIDESFYRDVIPINLKLTLFSQINKLILRCEEQEKLQKFVTVRVLLQVALKAIVELQSFIIDSQIDFEYDNVIELIRDQLQLMLMKKRKFSMFSLLFAFTIHLQSSSCYQLIRNELMLILPHRDTLMKLSRHQDVNVQNDNSNLSYLKKIVSNLTEQEKIVLVR